MPAGRYDSEWLLAQVVEALRRPSPDMLLSPAAIFEALSQAQEHWVGQIAVHFPQQMYGPPTQLVSADGGLTYTFGTDLDGDPITPLGEVEVRRGRRGRVLRPSVQWGDGGFVMEGNKIRFPDGVSENPGDGFWARFVTVPTQGIDADTEPVLFPKFARKLLVPRACALLCPRLKQDPTPYLEQEAQLWTGDAELGIYGLLGQLKQQFYGQGTEAIEGGAASWWHSIDDGSGYTKHL